MGSQLVLQQGCRRRERLYYLMLERATLYQALDTASCIEGSLHGLAYLASIIVDQVQS